MLKLHRLYEDYQRPDGTVDYRVMCDDLVEPVNEIDTQVESLGFLAEWSGIKYNTLARAAKEGRLEARRSGNVWLSDRQAVKTYRETAVFKPRKIKQ